MEPIKTGEMIVDSWKNGSRLQYKQDNIIYVSHGGGSHGNWWY